MPPPLSLWSFGLRSLVTEYGLAFSLRILLRHPLRSLRGLRRYLRGEGAAELGEERASEPPGLVGVGFCLKPLDPPCASGRANHDCLYFERRLHEGEHAVPSCCSGCAIRELGTRALRAGSALYVMTSARDILHDLLLPAFARRDERPALITLCRYSFEPFRLALLICGLRARLVPFASGDCRDWPSWRRADLGDKPERTQLALADQGPLVEILEAAALDAPPAAFARAGNLFVPEA
jgi:hypothetical protein